MKIIGALSLVFSLLAAPGYSQEDSTAVYPKMLIIEPDTVIAFTIEQSRELSRRNEELKKLRADAIDLENGLSVCKASIQNREDKIRDYEALVRTYDEEIFRLERLIEIAEEEKKLKDEEIQKQKTQKWVAIGVGILGTILGFLF